MKIAFFRHFSISDMKLIWNNAYQPKYSNPLCLYFDVKTIIYEDKHHLFFWPEMITFEEDKL